MDNLSTVQRIYDAFGRGAVAGFFAALDALEIHAFEPRNFLAGGDQVVVTFFTDVTHRASGMRWPDDELHLWTFGADGKVTAFRHYIDTARHIAAHRQPVAA